MLDEFFDGSDIAEGEAKSSPPAIGVPIVELGNNACRWPVGRGDDGVHLFCAAPRENTRWPYCASHNAVAYVTYVRKVKRTVELAISKPQR